jgi:hypothetical protein
MASVAARWRLEDLTTTQLEECGCARMVTIDMLAGRERRGVAWRAQTSADDKEVLDGEISHGLAEMALQRGGRQQHDGGARAGKQGAMRGNVTWIAREGWMASEAASPILAAEEYGMTNELFWRRSWRDCWTGVFANNSQI